MKTDGLQRLLLRLLGGCISRNLPKSSQICQMSGLTATHTDLDPDFTSCQPRLEWSRYKWTLVVPFVSSVSAFPSLPRSVLLQPRVEATFQPQMEWFCLLVGLVTTKIPSAVSGWLNQNLDAPSKSHLTGGWNDSLSIVWRLFCAGCYNPAQRLQHIGRQDYSKSNKYTLI